MNDNFSTGYFKIEHRTRQGDPYTSLSCVERYILFKGDLTLQLEVSNITT